jgi:uncharacterized protein (TIGR02246 family)
VSSTLATVLLVLLQVPAAATDAQQVTALVREYEGAMTRRDASVHERLFAEDYTYTPGNGAFMGREEHMKFTRSGALAIESFRSEDQLVRLYGHAAVVTGLWVSRDSRGGGPLRERRIRYLIVLAKRGGQWQIVAQQHRGVTVAAEEPQS